MKKILIVEDNELNITILDGILSNDYMLSIAQNDEEMVDILETLTPDLFLLDIVMEGKSGLDLCKELRNSEKFKQIPIIFMTAVQDKSVYDAAFKAGADAFITKPFKAAELKNAIANALS
jgi:CheY-like chemotaxis protein